MADIFWGNDTRVEPSSPFASTTQNVGERSDEDE